jgi:hypothetical protein
VKGVGQAQIVVRPLPGTTPEQARDARARAWTYVFQTWHTKKGAQHDLTKEPTPKAAKNRPRKTEQEKT